MTATEPKVLPSPAPIVLPEVKPFWDATAACSRRQGPPL